MRPLVLIQLWSLLPIRIAKSRIASDAGADSVAIVQLHRSREQKELASLRPALLGSDWLVLARARAINADQAWDHAQKARAL